MGSPKDQWGVFLHQCLKRRIDVLEFRDLSKILLSRCPVSELALLDLLLESPTRTHLKWDPLLPLYIDCLRKLGKLKASTVLVSLLEHSSVLDKVPAQKLSPLQDESSEKGKGKPPQQQSKPRGGNGYSTFMRDIRVIQDIMLSVSTGHIPATSAEAVGIFFAIAEWILAVVAWNHGTVDDEQQTGGFMSSADAISLFESLGILLAALSGSRKGLEVLSVHNHEALKVKLGQALSAYLPLCAGLSLPLRNRLDILQKDFHLYEGSRDPAAKALEDSMMDGVNVNALQFEASVMDEPVINSRAGLYIYVNAMLVGRPLVDDNLLVNYLNNRYGGQYEVLVEEIITATFDVLSNAMYRNESSRLMFLFRSFLVNKLPTFFAAMTAASMIPIPMELCISRALNRLDPNTFPSFSQMFAMQGNTVLSDVRQEFLFSCASHRLIPESSIERLLGENPMQTLPMGGPYLKDDLVSQINVSPDRTEQLINDLESMEGNAGAIVGAITEVMHNLCNQKETVTLKGICNSLSRRPLALDVILLFRSPKQVLQPLCSLIDTWHWDEEDQGENQPVYDEFGSVLLLVLVFKYRYDLSPYDLGITGTDSFILKLLDRGSYSQKLEELSEKQNGNLGAWIGALFIAEGISEETMSACSPQEFYLLVSTLFSQSLGACEAGKLEFETLKGGFEYLLEPFLLPSLIIALAWLGNHIWESESYPTIPLRTLYSLVKPNSISGDAQAIHSTVLNIVSRTLQEQLKDVRNRHPSGPDIKPLLDTLEPYHSFHRTGSCHHSELENWTGHPGGGGLLGSIRSTFQSLVLWSTNPEISMAPHSYTHRQILAGIRILGSCRVLSELIEELKLQTEAGSGPLALDLAATLVCSPLGESFAVDQYNYHKQHQQQGGRQQHIPESAKEILPRCPILTLRDALILEHENVPRISEKEPLRAQVIVRLHRRVNALLAPPSPQVPNLDLDNINIIQEMQLDGHAENNTQLQQHGHPSSHLDQSGLGNGQGAADDDNDPENISRMLNDAAAAAAAGMDIDGTVHHGLGLGGEGGATGGGDAAGTGLDTSIDDVLNAADMAVGNPEFLDLDMEGMF